jgi:hypothetical protein
MLRAPTPKHIKGKEATQVSRFRTGQVANKGNYLPKQRKDSSDQQHQTWWRMLYSTLCSHPSIHPRRPFP